MIHIAVCDDLSASRMKIDNLLEPYKKSNSLSVHIFSSGEELLAFPNYAATFSIVFLDIEMGNISGLDVAYDIRQKNKNVIIFLLQVMSIMSRIHSDSVHFSFLLNPLMMTILKKILKER